ncbi:sialate O-acetylesterase [Vicingaceae bacterium]|nr:sialate O-acetylesterase [Vicingaceae bacterium]
MSRIKPFVFYLHISILLTFAIEQAQGQKLKVFILAGQSNMEGQGVVDLDHPEYYNGGKGTLQHVMNKTADKTVFAHVKDEEGQWTVRDDVWVRFRTTHELKKGPLSIGFAGYPGRHHIGPEFQFGHVVGDKLEDHVLLIKTAWGGKSLYKDFRPPSAGGQCGEYYKKMIAEVRRGLDKIASDFPDLANSKVEIAGFVWFQGWNDMFDDTALKEYESNLICLANDVRKEFDNAKLPIVIGELGNGGANAGENMKRIRSAQKAAADHFGQRGNVRFVKTTDFARPKEESPNVGHGHHWFGNAESYFLIGDALGKEMLTMINR